MPISVSNIRLKNTLWHASLMGDPVPEILCGGAISAQSNWNINANFPLFPDMSRLNISHSGEIRADEIAWCISSSTVLYVLNYYNNYLTIRNGYRTHKSKKDRQWDGQN